uniref:Uncharacterized protein n=1 Tax=viral metagenome TaxID=1070528 RepID=A0A6C0D4L2_9ZZZZ
MKYLDEEEKFSSDPFEPEVILQKMKKIKKTKKKNHNYKNIEPLTNIYEDNIYEDNNYEEKKKDESKEKDTKKPVIIEGLSQDGIAHFSEDEYTGGPDNIFEGDGKSTVNIHNFSEFINYCYNLLHSIPLQIAIIIINRIEGVSSKINQLKGKLKGKDIKSDNYSKNDVVNDQRLIANYIGWFFCIIISMYVIFNWFFIVAYKNEEKKFTVLPTILDRKLLYNKGVFDPTYKLLHYFLEHSIFFPEYLQYGVVKISEKLRSSFNPSFIFSMLFFLIIFVLNNSMSFLRDLLIAIVSFDMKNIVLAIMFMIITALLAISFFKPPIRVNAESWDDVKVLLPSVTTQIADIVTSINPLKGIFNLVIYFFYLLFVVFLGVPIAAALCFGYLFTYTFFGITVLNGFDFKEMIKLIWEKIPKYARSEKDKIKVETFCDRLTFWEKIENMFHATFDVMYKYCFEIAFIYMLSFAMYDYWYNLKIRSVRLTLFSSSAILLIFTLAGMYIHYKAESGEMQNAAKTSSETVNV